MLIYVAIHDIFVANLPIWGTTIKKNEFERLSAYYRKRIMNPCSIKYKKELNIPPANLM